MNLWISAGWIACLLCNCGTDVSQQLPRTPASTFCKVVEDTTSPDGRMAVAVGLKQAGPVDWSRYDEQELGFRFDAEDLALANFLVDLEKDRAVALLASDHFGTRAQYNHQTYQAAWAPNSRFLVAVQSWKWFTVSAMLYVVDSNGAVAASMDLLPLVKEQLRLVAELDHNVSRQKFEKSYEVRVEQCAVDSTGQVTLDADAAIPISVEYPDVSLLIQFTAKAHGKGKLSAENLVVRDAEE